MTSKRDEAARESRADAGLTQNTDQAVAYETGFQAGWSACLTNAPEVLALVEALEWSLANMNPPFEWSPFVKANEALAAWAKAGG